MAETPTLATYEDVATYMQDDKVDYFAVSQALEYATAIMQAHTRQRLFFVADDDVSLPWPRSGPIVLPERPVESIGRVQFSPAYGTGWTLHTSSYVLLDGARVQFNAPWEASSYGGGMALVRYSHGYREIPPDLRAVAVGLAVRTLHQPTESLPETLDAYTNPASTAGPAGLTDAERAILRRYRVTTYAMG